MKPEKIQRVLDLTFEIERLERDVVMYGNSLKELKEHLLRMLVFWFEYWAVILYKLVKKASTVVYINKLKCDSFYCIYGK